MAGAAPQVLRARSNNQRLELGLVQAQFNELSAYVEIYRALGGGWQR
jgi:outer membrane protein TolC